MCNAADGLAQTVELQTVELEGVDAMVRPPFPPPTREWRLVHPDLRHATRRPHAPPTRLPRASLSPVAQVRLVENRLAYQKEQLGRSAVSLQVSRREFAPKKGAAAERGPPSTAAVQLRAQARRPPLPAPPLPLAHAS